MDWVGPLLDWYHKFKRSMPWRDDPQPYKVWVSEIMLQQTQVDTVIPYFNRFIYTFSTVYKLAESDLDLVLKHWEGLGYYSRARNLHKAAQFVVSDLSGNLPIDYKELQTIPGIGPYCAAAIGSIAFGLKTPVVDGNVLRVFARFWGDNTDIRDTKLRKVFYNKLSPYIEESATCEPITGPSSFNQAIMELGATVCKPQSPKCNQCPLSSNCTAFNSETVHLLPVKSKKAAVPHYSICVGIIKNGESLLIGKRHESKMLGGLWEFPGGKKKENESEEEAVVREVLEETDLVVSVTGKLTSIKHTYSHFKITLNAYHCEIISGVEQPLSATELVWVKPSELSRYAFPTANKKVIELIV